nr:zinc finger, CCHC-type, viral movement protein [Tanacetum cinerariifolium]
MRHKNGLVDIKFSSSQSKSDHVFPIGIHMITPTDQEPAQEVKHIWWDQKLKRRYEKGDPTVGLLGEPSGKFDYYVLYPKAEPSQPPSPTQPPSPRQPPSPHKAPSPGLIHPPSRLTDKRQRKNVESTVQFDAEEYEEHQENPNQETPTEFPKSDIKQYFTFNDVSPLKWHKRSIKMLTWYTAELQYYTIEIVIKRFLTRLQGRLKDWYHSLGEYQSLGNKAYQTLEARNVTIAQTTLGELYQLILNALVKLYNQKKFLAEFERTRKRLGTACDDKYLQIKCKDKSSCASFAKKRDHFARNCLDKKRSQALIQALNQVEPVDISNLESLYSLDDEPSDSVLCTISYSDLSPDDDSNTESDSDFGVHMINPIPHVLPIQEDPPLPLAKIHLLTDTYAKPIMVIAFFDTGSSVSILNPNILLDYYWKPHYQNFMAANGEKFVIDKISVLINIQLFPKCVIKRRLLGSSSHGKDLLIGFDILHKLPNLRWTDVNPTKASHPRMNLDHYQLAKEECEQLVSQGIIEPTTSPWACKAFYVNKRSEQVCRKLRLVINYQPLNHFLADDKFLLPQKKSLFKHLADAKVLSRFDLKSRFWQLGIKPEDRPKTAFCIPDHHYQWKVMSFGLKNVPSAFQKAMIAIFEPILANTLVYIDDILLFSPDEQSHAELLSKFYSLVTKYE